MDEAMARWNDEMFLKHPTPYGRGIAARIEFARVRTVVRLADVKPQDRVLDVGCGAGHVIVALPACRRRVGLDISPKSLEAARARAAERGQEGIEFGHFDANDPLPYPEGSFDVIICSEVLEHVPEPRNLVENIHRVAGPATRVVVTVPNERPKLLIKRVLKALGLMRILFPGIEVGPSEGHLHNFSKRMLVELVSDLFRVERLRSVRGCHYAARLRKRQAGA